MRDSAPMSLPDAMRELARPCAIAEPIYGRVFISLWPNGVVHGGTTHVLSLDREMATVLLGQLTDILAR